MVLFHKLPEEERNLIVSNMVMCMLRFDERRPKPKRKPKPEPSSSELMIVRYLEELPNFRCRARGPDGLTIFILKVPSDIYEESFEPGTYLEASINTRTLKGEPGGEVISILETQQIAELLLEGEWPSAFIETEYISEKIKELFQHNSRNNFVINRRR